MIGLVLMAVGSFTHSGSNANGRSSRSVVALALSSPLNSSRGGVPLGGVDEGHDNDKDRVQHPRRGRTTSLRSSYSLTMDSEDASGLWKMQGRTKKQGKSGRHRQPRRKEGRGSHNMEGSQNQDPNLELHGPRPRDGSAVVLSASLASSAAATAALDRSQPFDRVRTGFRGARKGFVSTIARFANNNGNGRRRAVRRPITSTPVRPEDVAAKASSAAVLDTNAISQKRSINLKWLRVGVVINRRLKRDREERTARKLLSAQAALSTDDVDLMQMETVDSLGLGEASDSWLDLDMEESYLAASRIDSDALDEVWSMSIASSAAATDLHDPAPPASIFRDILHEQSSQMSTAVYRLATNAIRGGDAAVSSPSLLYGYDDSYVIQTPFFPIVLPKSWEPPSVASREADPSAAAARTASLEISVALRDDVASTTTSEAAHGTATPEQVAAATMPLLPAKNDVTFSGYEFEDPESMCRLVETGLRMTLGDLNEYVVWSGDKKTDRFIREVESQDGEEGGVATTAVTRRQRSLIDSQEVLVWSGKFKSSQGYGAELPIIKTTSIIDKSPQYLADLLMDSNKVKLYNKMSLGRDDVKVFQSGIDTLEGKHGDGESKIVRNLTKPPMVNGLLEFVTCMHARRLRPSDSSFLGEEAEGYVVVSRAVLGDKYDSASDSGEKLVRNEILLGVNVLKSIPGEPGRTELTAVTHVYSPMIPLMLAKNAGVKGAVDFVRDIRALP